MIEIFINLYVKSSTSFRVLSGIKFDSFARKLIEMLAFLYMLLFRYPCLRKINLKKGKQSKINTIVSLTTFPGRINSVWMVVDLLLRQTYLPDRIILWLSREQFGDIRHLPFRLRMQINQGLEIFLVDKDMKSHKKYIYCLDMFPDSLLITVDDDILYGKTMIEDLINLHKLFPTSVIAHRALALNYNGNELQNYSTWKTVEKAENSDKNIFFTSGAGTLFPPNSLHELSSDANLAIQLTPLADDVWLNAMVRLKNGAVVKSDYSSIFLPVLNFSKANLSSFNIAQSENDKQIQNLRVKCIELLNVDPFKIRD